MRHRVRLAILIAGCAAAIAAPTSAQDALERMELGGQVVGLGLLDDEGRQQSSPGVGGWIGFAVASRLAVEGRVTWFPVNEPTFRQQQGGRTLLFAAGLRADLARSSTIALQGFMTPGLLHFTRSAEAVTNRPDVFGPSTRLSLDLGLGMEVPAASRWALRLDFAQTLYPIRGFILAESPPDPNGNVLVVSEPGEVKETWQAAAGIRFRSGRSRPAAGSSPTTTAGRWAIGPQAGVVVLRDGGLLSPRVSSTVGGFVSYRLLDWLYPDGSVTASLQGPSVRSETSGGALLQALAGAKVGRRYGRLGAFFKVRAGVNSYGGAVKLFDPALRTKVLTRATTFAVDLGGVVELHRGRRLFFRLDAGDLSTNEGPFEKHSIQMTAGAGWTF